MENWPANYAEAWTLSKPFTMRGIGLHSGEESEVRLIPSKVQGFHLFSPEKERPMVTLSQEHVRDSQLCTTLELDINWTLATVEHLFAALAGCGVSHVEIHVSGKEVPLLDGSSLEWVEAIKAVGLVPAATSRSRLLTLSEPLTCNRGNSVITATPAKEFSLVGVIDFPQGAIGRQIMSIDLTPNSFVKEIAPARTFGFIEQVEFLKESGLIKGGGLENALVCDGDKWMNPPLRFDNEPVRHKLLDLIGDLALVGFPKAQILVYRGSHALHNDLALALSKVCTKNYSLD